MNVKVVVWEKTEYKDETDPELYHPWRTEGESESPKDTLTEVVTLMLKKGFHLLCGTDNTMVFAWRGLPDE